MTPTITPRENWIRVLKGEKPEWMPCYSDYQVFNPRIVPDYKSRAFAFDAEGFLSPDESGGKDMYGINWVYVPAAAGSMEDPDEPHRIPEIKHLRASYLFHGL